jgi:hypothetical protein
MSNKAKRLVKTKALKKILRRSSSTIGAAALATVGLAAAVMNPKVREQTRRLKDRILTRLQERRSARADLRFENGRVSEHAH